MPMTLDDDECYRLFLSLDDLARIYEGKHERVNAQREKFLKFYSDWHNVHPFDVHPSAYEHKRSN